MHRVFFVFCFFLDDSNSTYYKGFPGGSAVNSMPANAGDTDLTPGLGRSPGEGNVNPFQYSCLENPMDRGALWAMVHSVTRVRHDLATKPRFSPVQLCAAP